MTWAVPAEQDGDPALEQTRADLEELLAARFPLTAAQPANTGLTVEVRLGEPEDIAGAEVPVELADQAYRIEISVKPARVGLTGYGIPGLGYAVVSLRQLLRTDSNGVSLPELEILDWPAQQVRGSKIESGAVSTRLMSKQDWFDLVDYLADLKFNTMLITVYGCWSVSRDGLLSEVLMTPLECYPQLKTSFQVKYYSPSEQRWIHRVMEPRMFAEDFFGEVVRYARRHSIKVIPFVNSLGHNTLIPRLMPEIAPVGADGTPQGIGFCLSNPKTYEVLFNIYDEIIDKYLLPNNLNIFNVGLDEVWTGIGYDESDIFGEHDPWCHCPECSKHRQADRFVEHVIRLTRHLKERGFVLGMCADVLINRGDRGNVKYGMDDGLIDRFAERLEKEGLKDWVRLDWWTYNDLHRTLMFPNTRPDLGMRGVTVPWTGFYHNSVLISPLRNIMMMAKMAQRDGLEGTLAYSSNDPAYDRNFSVLADCTWNDYEEEQLEEVSGYYAQAHFGTGSALVAARRGFRLLDLMCEERPDLPDGEEGCVSNFHLLVYMLSPMFYVHPVAGQPYPRTFPGVPLGKLLKHRENYERALDSIVSMGLEARSIFTQLAGDSAVNQAAAARYAYEADNIVCVAENYLALLRMADLATARRPGWLDEIAVLADGRYKECLDVMAHLERVKPAFVMEHDMRDRSV
ncbi:MAG: family 20 glycosylhydrolase, partial [Clostridiaceae bacterium]|nr:family 20 glycosylhydrolase [Clostridiaceae bacterium]